MMNSATSTQRLGRDYLFDNVDEANHLLDKSNRGLSLEEMVANDPSLAARIMEMIIKKANAVTRFSHVANRIKQLIRNVESTADVVIFGSRARGDFREDSDWDTLIITDNEAHFRQSDEFSKALYQLLPEEGEIATVFLISRADWLSGHNRSPMIESVRNEGVFVP